MADILYEGGVGSTISNLTVTGTLTFDTAGTYYIVDSNINEVVNTSGGNVQLVLDNTTITSNPSSGTGAGEIATEAAGISITINNLTSSFVELFDSTFTSQDRDISLGATYTFDVPDGSTGPWYYVINREGYAPITGSFDPIATDITIDGTLRKDLTPDGGDMYLGAGGGSFLTVEILPSTPRVNLRIGDGIVTAQQGYDGVEDAMMSSLGMEWIARGYGKVFTSARAVGTFFDMEEYFRMYRNLAGDYNAEFRAIVSSKDGVVKDGSNGDVVVTSVKSTDLIVAHQGAVWVDTVNSSVSGTSAYNGTSSRPVNNISDALLIAEAVGLGEIKLLTDITIGDEIIAGKKISPGAGNVSLELAPSGAVTDGSHDKCLFEGFTKITGTVNGVVRIIGSTIEDLLEIDGELIDVSLSGTCSIAPDATVVKMRSCHSSVAGDTKPVLSFTGCTTLELNNRDYQGGLELRNLTGVNCKISIDSSSQAVRIDDSCTAGEIKVVGTGRQPSIGGSVTSTVVVDVVSIEAIDAMKDEIVADLGIVNTGVQKASKLIPHSTNL